MPERQVRIEVPGGRRPPRLRWLVVMGIAGVLVGCSGNAEPPVASTGTLAPVQTGTVKVSSRDNSFIPETVTVKVGSEVVWTNDGRNDHNIVPIDGAPIAVDTAAFAPKAEYRHTFTSAGTFHYYCSIHGTADKGMIGVVQVVQ